MSKKRRAKIPPFRVLNSENIFRKFVSKIMRSCDKNFAQLQAATEEVTASAEQVHTLSEENLDVAKQVQNAVEKIHSTADDIKKFLH